MPLVAFRSAAVMAVLGLASLAFAGPRSPFVTECVRYLAEDVTAVDADAALSDWVGEIDDALRRPLEKRALDTSIVRLGFWNRPRERAFVRGSDFAALTAGQSLALSRRARSLHRAVRYASPQHPPVVYGPDYVSKAYVTELVLGSISEQRWTNVSTSIDRRERAARWAFRNAFAAMSATAGLAAGTFGLTLWEGEMWAPGPMVGFAATVASLVHAGLLTFRSGRLDNEVKALRETRSRMSGESIARFDGDSGPFDGPGEVTDFRRFAIAATEEWHDLREGDASRWWYFTGTQSGEALDMLVRSIPDDTEALELLAVVRGAALDPEIPRNATLQR